MRDHRSSRHARGGQLQAGDFVTIFTPDDTHFEIAMEAVRRKLHVLVTKPAVKVRPAAACVEAPVSPICFLVLSVQYLCSSVSVCFAFPCEWHCSRVSISRLSARTHWRRRERAQTLRHHRELLAAARAHGVIVAVEFHKRWDPMYDDARQRIRGLGTHRSPLLSLGYCICPSHMAVSCRQGVSSHYRCCFLRSFLSSPLILCSSCRG